MQLIGWKRLVLAGILGLAVPAVAQGTKPSAEEQENTTSAQSLEGRLEMFKRAGGLSPELRDVYTTAYEILSAKAVNGTYADVADSAEFQARCKKAGMTHFAGPILGAVSTDGVRVWLRTLTPADVSVEVMVGDQKKTFGPVKSTRESDLTAIVPVTGLQPATRYTYKVLVNGQPVKIPEDAAITTAPPDEKSQVRIVFGSCPHLKGLANMGFINTILGRQPAAMLMYGDGCAGDRGFNVGLHRIDHLIRDFYPAWQRLSASVPFYNVWDDHDYFGNEKGGLPFDTTPADRDRLWNAFRQLWNNPSYGFGENGGGIFLRTRIGPCDVIMLDNRYFRENSKDKKVFLGEEQMKWFETQLLDCKGPFIVISCGTMWSDWVSNGKGSWGVLDPEGRERIFRLIEKHRIPGVLLVSGDRHGARGFRIPRPSGYHFYEFEPASLGGRGGPPLTDPTWTTQLFGHRVQSFGEFTIDATKPDPEVTMRLIEHTGKTLYEITLKRSELTPPKED